jgi:hypothetical protein
VRFNALAGIFMKKYWIVKVLFFSWFRCEIQCICMNFHEKILKCQSSFSFLIQMWDSMHLHEFSWKNIELSKFFFFLVQMWDSMNMHEFSWKNIEL